MARTKKVKETKPLWAVLIVDESGSMSGQRAKTISGINEFLGDRRKDAEKLGQEVRVWLTTFSTKTKTLMEGIPAGDTKEIGESDYAPYGNTALLDSVGDTLAKLEKEMIDTGVDPNTLICIVTDGQENASQEYKTEQIREKIKHFQDTKNWGFVFLGANQNAWATAGALGMSRGNAATMSKGQLVNSTGLRYASAGISAAYASGGLSNQSVMTSLTDSTGNLIDDPDENKATSIS